MKTSEFPSVIAAGKAAKANLDYYKRMMKKPNPAQVAIDNLRELALYSETCWFNNVIDDELYDLLVEGSWKSAREFSALDAFGQDGMSDHCIRRMYFLFMAEMLDQCGGLPDNKPLWVVHRDNEVKKAMQPMYDAFEADPENWGSSPTWRASVAKPPFDGVGWLFDNHWITYADVQRVREAERNYCEE